MTTIRLLVGAFVALGMVGLGPVHPARAATKDLGCPSYANLASAVQGASAGDVLRLVCSTPTTIPFTNTLTISRSLTLDASGSPAAITFDGGGAVQLLAVGRGVTFGLNSLTLYHGTPSLSLFNIGGAIDNNSGTVTVANSTFWQNTAASGGAIASTGGTVTITNSTFVGNEANFGGAIDFTGHLTIRNSTFSGNSTARESGAIEGVSATVGGTILANNRGGNCNPFRPLTDSGYNLTDAGGNCGLTSSTDLVNTDPQLKPLADNGGPTPTMALSPTSPAMDRIPKGSCPPTDQRGVPRPASPKAACDIGAYEYVFPRPNGGPVALPYVRKQPSGGLTAGFDVLFDSATAGDGRIFFGPGPGCTGLIGTATRDDAAGTTSHLVHVTGDEMNLSSGAVLPGATYSVEVVTVTKTGVEIDNNGGSCYTVTVPSR